MKNIEKMSAKGIYVHIPFCVKKCIYCDFNSYPGQSDEIKEKYFDALYRECQIVKEISSEKAASTEDARSFAALKDDGKDVRPGERTGAAMPAKDHEKSGIDTIARDDLTSGADTLFIGGGTPSSVDASYIARLVQVLDMPEGAECTIEANPGTLTQEALLSYKKSGINRLSMGVQSFVDEELAFLGRVHSASDAVKSFAAARSAGFDNINIDLIFGFPGHTMDSWKRTLEEALELGPEHISFYSLQIEEGTPLYDMFRREEARQIDDELNRQMYHYAVKRLKDAGYHHYEISNAALPGRECRHNLGYWRMREYVGVGAGAHSFVSGWRFSNPEDIEEYINFVDSLEIAMSETSGSVASDGRSEAIKVEKTSACVQENCNAEKKDRDSAIARTESARTGSAAGTHSCALSTYISAHEDAHKNSRADDITDYLFTGLRLLEGFSLQEFRERYGEDFYDIYHEKVADFMSEGFLAEEDGRLRFTRKGLDISNFILAELM